ncbi:unnamed protein product [Triticum turgidum subsp. durum]|uniref:F-box associated domain-containing protein n=1 Tax=Triticum turgidum subsp. durum TaxID=4567 RepID=A0A9R1S8Z6_TRITD|nr:unnamed protein product [Triticum turgidum subsp. durum]
MQYEADESESNVMMVFDTTVESFRQMRAPDDLFRVDLFETDGMLGLSSLTGAATITSIDIWLMQDYETEVWALKYWVELQIQSYWDYLAAPWDGGVLVLLKPDDHLLQIDIDGKVVAGFHHRGLNPTPHWLKQSLVSHTFFPTLEGYAVNALPFI